MEKKAEKDGEKKRWRGEWRKKKKKHKEAGELSFEVAAGSFTFRNEIVSLLCRTIDPLSSFFSTLRLFLSNVSPLFCSPPPVSRSSLLHIRIRSNAFQPWIASRSYEETNRLGEELKSPSSSWESMVMLFLFAWRLVWFVSNIIRE